jgi:hypothetical protein
MLPQLVGEPDDGCQDVVEVVRNAARELPDGFQALRLPYVRIAR